MFIKKKDKKKAYAFIESLIVFLFVLVIVNLCIKIIYNNYLKSQNYMSYKDTFTLEGEEEKVLEIVNTNAEDKNLNNEELLQKVKSEKSKMYPDLKKLDFIYKNENYYLVKKKENSVMYIQLAKKDVGNKTYFIPTTYRTKYIYLKE